MKSLLSSVMKLYELLAGPDAALPRDWEGDEFVPALTRMLQRYTDAVGQLDDDCPLGQQVKARLADIEKCGRHLAGAVQSYAKHRPADVASCSIKRRYDGAAFNVEFVVPNAVMQWIQQNAQVDGIRYFSTRHGPDDPSLHALEWINYALPTGELGPSQAQMKGYSSKLHNLLRQTDAVEVDVSRLVAHDLAYAKFIYDDLVGRAATRFEP
jgi:hypothetical protein